MLKSVVKPNNKHLFVPSKTSTLVPEFAVEDLPLGKTAAFMPEFAVKILGQNTLMMMINVFRLLKDVTRIKMLKKCLQLSFVP